MSFEYFKWNILNNRFEFSDDIHISGCGSFCELSGQAYQAGVDTLDSVCDRGHETDQDIHTSGDLYVDGSGSFKEFEHVLYADHYNSIQSAIDDLPALGGTVIISPGIHNISLAISIPDNTTLRGAGIGLTTIRLIDNSNCNVIINSLLGSANLYNKNICIKNLTIDGNKDNQGDESVFNLFGMLMNHSAKAVDNLLIQNVEVKNCKEQGMGLVGDHIKITNCISSNNKWNNITLEGNYNIIDSTTCSGSLDCGIEITTGSNGCVVADCTLINNNHGVLIRGAIDVSVVGCSFYGAYGDGEAIHIWAPSGELAENVTVDGCSIYDADVGIYLNELTGGTVKGIIVDGNNVKYCKKKGISLKSTSNNVISNNVVYNCGRDDASNTGIFLENSSYNLVVGNKCFDDQGTKTQKYGIKEHGTADYNRITGNDFRGNLDGEMLILGANTITQNYENNRFEFSDNVYVSGDIEVVGSVYINRDGPDGDSYLYFYDNGLPAGASLRFQDNVTGFVFSKRVFVEGDFSCNALSADGNIDATGDIKADGDITSKCGSFCELSGDLKTHIDDITNPHQVTFDQARDQQGGSNVTLAELEELTDGSVTALHAHAGAGTDTLDNVCDRGNETDQDIHTSGNLYVDLSGTFGTGLFSKQDIRIDDNVYINNDYSDSNAIIYFGKSNFSDEALYWNKTGTRFQFTNDLYVDGNLTTEGVDLRIDVLGMGTSRLLFGPGINALRFVVGTGFDLAGSLEVSENLTCLTDIKANGELSGEYLQLSHYSGFPGSPANGMVVYNAISGDFYGYDGTWTSLTAVGNGGAATFLELTDTPGNYAGDGGKVVKVNVGENALEFAGADTLDNVCDRGNTTDQDITAAHLKSNGNVYVNHDGPNANSYIYFYANGSPTDRYFKWNDAFDEIVAGVGLSGQIRSTNNIYAEDDIKAGGDFYLNYAGLAQDAIIYFYKPGAGNETLRWNRTTTRFEFSDDLYVLSSELGIGDGTTGANKVIYANNGDANLPNLRYNESTNKWQYSNDGVAWSDIGSGGAGTGTIIIPVQGAKMTGSYIVFSARVDAGNAAWRLLFSATQTESAIWQFRMPQDYASGLVVKLIYTMVSATADKVDMEVEVMALSDGEADPDTASFDAVNEIAGGTTVPDTAGKIDEISITCSNDDGVAAGDLVIMRVNRDHDDADDTATGDLELRAVSLEYQTT